VAIGALFAMPMVCGAYVVLAFLLPRKEYTGTARDYGDPLEQQVRASTHDTLASVRYRFSDLDGRLQQLEKYVTSSRYKLDREFRKLQD
jgi:phage shock protein C